MALVRYKRHLTTQKYVWSFQRPLVENHIWMRIYYIFSFIKGSNGQRNQCLAYSSFNAVGILFLFFTLNWVFTDRIVNQKHSLCMDLNFPKPLTFWADDYISMRYICVTKRSLPMASHFEERQFLRGNYQIIHILCVFAALIILFFKGV